MRLLTLYDQLWWCGASHYLLTMQPRGDFDEEDAHHRINHDRRIRLNKLKKFHQTANYEQHSQISRNPYTKHLYRPNPRGPLLLCHPPSIEAILVRIPEIPILQIGHILKGVQVQNLSTFTCPVPLSIPLNQYHAHNEDIHDENDVKTEMDVKTVVISRRPFGLEELWTDGVTRCPSNDCYHQRRVSSHFLHLQKVA